MNVWAMQRANGLSAVFLHCGGRPVNPDVRRGADFDAAQFFPQITPEQWAPYRQRLAGRAGSERYP